MKYFFYNFRFKRENEDKLENNQKARFASFVIQNWLGLRLQLIGIVVVAVVGVAALVQHLYHMANPGKQVYNHANNGISLRNIYFFI